MGRKFTKRQREKQRKRLAKAIFDSRSKPDQWGCHKIKPSILKKQRLALKQFQENRKELFEQVEGETQEFFEKIVVPKFKLKKGWHIHVHTR